MSRSPGSAGAWGSSSQNAQNNNPFLSDNPFASSDTISNEQIVENLLRGPEGSSTASRGGGPSGSPALSSPPRMQDVPLYDTATQYATPRSTNTRNGAGAGGGLETTAKSKPQRVPFETTASATTQPVTKKSSGLGRFFGGGGTSSNSSASALPITSSPALNGSPSLQRREADLARRETDLARREQALAAAGAKKKNFPRFMPLVHHDIAGDIPAERRGLVRTANIAWWLVAMGYVWNFICLTAFWIGGEKKVSLWVMAGLVAVAGLPLSFLCWYKGLYNACARDSGVRWFWYLLHMLAHIVWCWWMFVGINPDLGGYSAGLFTMIDQFSNGGGEGIAFAIMCIINMALFASSGLISMGVFGRSWALFRSGPPVPVERVRM